MKGFIIFLFYVFQIASFVFFSLKEFEFALIFLTLATVCFLIWYISLKIRQWFN